MSLDIRMLERPRLRGRYLIARCPACADRGGDRKCEHLSIADGGRGGFRCVVDNRGKGGAHNKRIYELVGLNRGWGNPAEPSPLPAVTKERGRLSLPSLRHLTGAQFHAIAKLRRWRRTAGAEILGARGLLWYDDIFDYDTPEKIRGHKWPAWVITDSSRFTAQARRLDGCAWSGIRSKAKTLPGGDNTWPIGAAEISTKPFVILCEGQPDFCAAPIVAHYEGLHLDNVAPVCICGTGSDISPAAYPSFAGKRVRIAVHDDEVGRDAAKRWSSQLYSAGASVVDGFDFRGLFMADGKPVEDLADYCATLGASPPQPPRMFTDVFDQFHKSLLNSPATPLLAGIDRAAGASGIRTWNT